MDELADRYPPLNRGALCLDFANTLEPGALDGQDRDHLGTDRRQIDHSGLLAWLAHAGVLDEAGVGRLSVLGSENQAEADEVVAAATSLRSAIAAVFTAVAAKEPLPPEADRLKRAYAAAISAATLEADETGVRWVWPPCTDLAALLHPIAASAVELLTSNRVSRVKQCEGDKCWVLFLDTTKNASRRWCLMRYCGNVAKSRRQATRRRQLRAERRKTAASESMP